MSTYGRPLYLVPDLFGRPGGIARYCRMVCRGLVASGVPVRTIALHDVPAAREEARKALPAMSYMGCSSDRIRFSATALSALSSRPTSILVGHVNFAPLGYALSRLLRIPFSVFMYGVEVWDALPPSRGRALRAADEWIAISEYTARQAAKANGLDADRIAILNNCLDPDLDKGIAQSDQDGQLSLLTVGRIEAGENFKGHDFVLRAMPALLQRFPTLVYDVVGDGKGRPTLEALAQKLGVSGAVRFHGVVSEEELVRRYAEASVFIMPSRREGFGFVFLEAMAYGKPAIGGNEDATPEVIADGVTGYVVDARSPSALAEAAGRLLADASLRRRMGEAAAARARERFGFPHFQQGLLSQLSNLYKPRRLT
jgi:phosphatidyl-myo-inositol dimannoside synthase